MAPLSRPLVRLLTLLSIASLVLVGLILYASPSASSIASRYRGQLGAQFQGLKDPTQWGINPWRRPGTGTGTGTGTGEGAIPSFKGEEAAVVADSATATSGHPFLNGQPVIWVNGKGWVQADSDPPGDVTAPVRPTAPIPSTPAQAQQRPTESVKMIIPDWLLPPEDRPPVPPPRFEPDPPGLPIPSPPQTTSSPLLNVRLAQLLAAPAPGRLEAFLANLEKCSHTIFQTDITQLVQHRKFWVEDVQSGREVLHKWRGELVRALERLESKGVPIVAKGEKGTGSKGIVFAPRLPSDLQGVLTTLHFVRSYLQSAVPVEVWYLGAPNAPANLDATQWRETRVMMEQLGAKIMKLEHAGSLNSTTLEVPHLRAAAMVASSFDQVLYLDPDSLPLRDPSGLFSSPLYKQHGAVFWPSINRDHPDNPIWRFIGQPCSNEFWQLDAGQMLVDKRGNDGLNLAALQLAAYMQKPQSHASTTDPDEGFGGASFFSQLSDEGRDEIRYGFMTLNISYNPAPRWLSAAGTRVVESEGGSGLTASNDEAGKFCGHSLLQYDVEPRAGASSRPRPSDYSPLFLHNNLTDQVRGLAPGRFWTHLKHFADNDVDSVGLESARAHVVRLGDGARAFHCLEVEMQHGGSGNGLIVTDKTKNVWQGKFAEWENAYWDSRRKAERAAPDYTRLRRVRRRLEEMDAGADAFFVA